MIDQAPIPKFVWIISVAVLAFLMFPVFVVVPISFSAATYLQFPPEHWSLQWYEKYFSDPEWVGATFASLRIGICVMILATVLGGMAAFATARSQFIGKAAIYGFILSPLIVPFVVTGIAMYFLFSKLGLVDTEIGIIAAHTVVTIPLAVILMTASIDGFDARLEQAAGSLGAGRWYTMRRVTLPLLLPGIATTAILTFLTSFDEVVIAIFLSNTNTVTLPKKMWEGVWLEITPTIAAASSVLIVLTVVIFLCVDRLQEWGSQVRVKR